MGSLPYPNPQAVFQQQFEVVRRDEVLGVLLALFLGCFGVHHFYVGRVGLGILYCCFCWTGIPSILGFIECFFMPGRVRMYNAMQAAGLAAAMGIGIPGWVGYPGWVAPGYVPNVYAGQIYADWVYADRVNADRVYTNQAYTNQPYSGQSYAGQVLTPALGTALVEATSQACTRCGRANVAGGRFCPGCGNSVPQ